MKSNTPLLGDSFTTPEKQGEKLLVIARATTDVQMQVSKKIGENTYPPFLVQFVQGNLARENVVSLFKTLQSRVNGYQTPSQKIPISSFDSSIDKILNGETSTLFFYVTFDDHDGNECFLEWEVGELRDFSDPNEYKKFTMDLLSAGYTQDQIDSDFTQSQLGNLGLHGIRSSDSADPYEVLFFCTRGGGTHHVVSTLSMFENYLEYHKHSDHNESLLTWNAKNVMFNFVPHITFPVEQPDGTFKEMPFMLRVGKHRKKINVEELNHDAQEEVTKILDNKYGGVLVSGTIAQNPWEKDLFENTGSVSLFLQPTIHAIKDRKILSQLKGSIFSSFNETELLQIASHCDIKDTNEYETVHEKYGNILSDLQRSIGGLDNSIRVCTLGSDGAILLHTQGDDQKLYAITSRMGESENEERFLEPIVKVLGEYSHLLSVDNGNTIGCGDTAFAAAIMTDHPFYKEMRSRRYTYLQRHNSSPEKVRDCEMIMKLIWIKVLSGIVYRTQYTHIPNWLLYFKNENSEKFRDVVETIYRAGVVMFERVSKRYFAGEIALHFDERDNNYGVFKL